MTRVLILTASVGEGHDLPARTLADQLRSEAPGVDVVTEDGLRVMGRPFVLLNERAPGVVFFRFRWLWDAAFWLFVALGPTRRLTQRLVRGLGSRGVLGLIQRVQPDVIVSVYPMTTEVLGGLRRKGKLDVPVVAGITDLAAMHYWAAPGVDLHLLTHPESEEEVRRVAGRETDVQAVHGLTRPEFSRPCDPAEARAALSLPRAGKIVLVSGGGWGVGDLEGAIETALAVEDVEVVACLCGRNEDLRARLAERYAGERVRLVGFTEQMSEWLAAADALVHSTGGLTVLEAYVRGCPTISYGWGRGHIRANNAAFRRYGIAEVVAGPRELDRALRAALASRPAPGLALGSLPSAASLVLSLVV
ncbi:MAG: glycosyltransferase [Thermoleophilia bacterium]|nr:glycosyltransferase [Thermoleophilia bacterium]